MTLTKEQAALIRVGKIAVSYVETILALRIDLVQPTWNRLERAVLAALKVKAGKK